MNSREIRRVTVSRAVFGTVMLSLAAVTVQAQDELNDFAGNGEADYGSADDGNPAIDARLNSPVKMVFDASDNAFIADFANNRIRRIDGVTDNITTVAGTGLGEPEGLEGTALAVNFNGPISVAVDATGNLYVAELNSSLLRKIDTMGNVTTIAGIPGDSGRPRNGDENVAANTVRLNSPWDIDVSSDGDIYIAENLNHCVRRIDGVDGTISTVVGDCRNGGFSGDGGAATDALLNRPQGVFVDANENLYIADSNNHRVRFVDSSTGQISTVAGNGTAGLPVDGGLATESATRDPRRIFVNSAGEIYLNDVDNHVIRKVGTDGIISTIAGIPEIGDYTGRGHVATQSALNLPQEAVEDSIGTVYIVDQGNHRIRRIDPATPNNPPTDIGNTAEFVADATEGDNARVGGLMLTEDLDTPPLTSQDGLFEYTLVDGNGDDDNDKLRFRGGNNRVLQFIGATSLPQGDYNIRVQTEDEEGATYQKAIIVSLVSGAPVITLLGDNPQIINFGDAYTELNATASDAIDGDVTADIVIDASEVNTSLVGTYEVRYQVTDSDGNPAEANRTVQVVDNEVPSIELNGANPQEIVVGGTYAELGATAVDNADGDISDQIVIDASAVDTDVLGDYQVTYNVMDSSENAATQVVRTVTVIDGPADMTPPVITLTGDNPQVIEVGGIYTELGATANDNIDNDISGNIVIDSSAVDTDTVGSYEVTYNVSDSSGNAADEQVRTVSVVEPNTDTTPPVITLTGDAAVTLTVGDTYTEEGATAEDDVDGDISGDIVIGGDAVDTSTAGTYEVTYDVSDAAGNAATTVTRTVTVEAAPVTPPVTPPPSNNSSGGGGSFGLLTLLGLAIVGMRRRMISR